MSQTTPESPAHAQGTHKKEGWQSLEQTVMDNRNPILGGLVVLLLLVGGLIGYKQLFVKPREAQAQNRMAEPQQAFSVDSFALALNGNSLKTGFLQIADDFGMTPTGKLAHGYAAICQLQLGNFDEALRHGKKYRSDDELLDSRVLMVMAHAYTEKGDFDNGIKYYVKAAEVTDNPLTTPQNYYLAGLAAMEKEKFAEAVKYFQQVKDRYPQSREGQSIDKFLALANQKSKG
ncbi:MAG: tetratricopeptide repeat protein [Bacteroidetes bacterium]|nr:tetratricopeptide repeat protein [Bacteroidota bacterium]